MDASTGLALLALGGAGATLGLVEVVKRLAKMPAELEGRVAPVLAILIGCGWNWLLLSYLRADDARAVTVILYGLLSGLAASGLWSGSKATIVEPNREREPAVPHG